MAIVEPNMGLRIWNLPSDPYDSQQLADNFGKLGNHDHVEGRGVPIPTSGLADGAVTAAKLAPGAINSQTIPANSVGAGQIIDGSVGTAELAANAVTEPKLDPNVVPIGSVIPWWRPTGATPVPTGWVVANGATVSDHSFGGGPITIPDLRNRFVLGAATSGTGTGNTTPPDIGSTGGATNHSLSHTHTLSHTHDVVLPGHTHPFDINHSHSYGAYFKGIAANTITMDATSVMYMLYASPGLDRTIPNVAASDPSSNTATAGAGTVTSAAASTSTTSSTTQDIRPQFVGLLYIIKVKHG